MHCIMQNFKKMHSFSYTLEDRNISHYVELGFLEGKLGSVYNITHSKIQSLTPPFFSPSSHITYIFSFFFYYYQLIYPVFHNAKKLHRLSKLLLMSVKNMLHVYVYLLYNGNNVTITS